MCPCCKQGEAAYTPPHSVQTQPGASPQALAGDHIGEQVVCCPPSSLASPHTHDWAPPLKLSSVQPQLTHSASPHTHSLAGGALGQGTAAWPHLPQLEHQAPQHIGRLLGGRFYVYQGIKPYCLEQLQLTLCRQTHGDRRGGEGRGRSMDTWLSRGWRGKGDRNCPQQQAPSRLPP